MTLQVLPRYQDRREHIACGHLVHRLQRETSGGFTVDQDIRLSPDWYEGNYRETDIIDAEIEGSGRVRRHVRWLRVKYACEHCGGVVLWESLTRPVSGPLPEHAYYESDDRLHTSDQPVAQVAAQMSI